MYIISTMSEQLKTTFKLVHLPATVRLLAHGLPLPAKREGGLFLFGALKMESQNPQTMIDSKGCKWIKVSETLRYSLINWEHSSFKYGPCGICFKHVPEVFNISFQEYCPPQDGLEGFWHQIPGGNVGHEKCLLPLIQKKKGKTIDHDLTVTDLQILKDHGISMRLSDFNILEVMDRWSENGVAGSAWITAPFKNTKQLLGWLGY